MNEFRSFIIGTVLGDSSLCGRKNKYIYTGHSEKQYEYLMWKKEFLLANLPVGVTTHKREFKTGFGKGNRESFYKLFSTSHHKLTSLYKLIYDETNKKRITKELLSYLTPLGLAVFFLDDGCKETSWNKTKEYRVIRRYSFSLGSFTLAEARIFSEWLKERYDIKNTLFLVQKKYPSVKITTAEERMKFVDLIAPYVPEFMKHKLY